MLRTIIVTLFFVSASPVFGESELPDGEGRLIVEDVCSMCHGLMNITDIRRTPEQWQYIVNMMVNQGAPLEDYEIDIVIEYLSKNFGEES